MSIVRGINGDTSTSDPSASQSKRSALKASSGSIQLREALGALEQVCDAIGGDRRSSPDSTIATPICGDRQQLRLRVAMLLAPEHADADGGHAVRVCEHQFPCAKTTRPTRTSPIAFALYGA